MHSTLITTLAFLPLLSLAGTAGGFLDTLTTMDTNTHADNMVLGNAENNSADYGKLGQKAFGEWGEYN